MENPERGSHDKTGYLERMSKALQEKLRIAEFINPNSNAILDVGCANGVLTNALAHLFPYARFHGIDLDEDFIATATATRQEELEHPPTYEKVYLRELLERPQRYDEVLFNSVLHEFYSYGNREPSVMKAIADAYELLNPGGRIIIRDMIPPQSLKDRSTILSGIVQKISVTPHARLIPAFQAEHGAIDTILQANHFLLKYMYTDNWERECRENYVPVTREQYEILCAWLGAELVHTETYLLPYLQDKWRADFGFSDYELKRFISTTIIVAQKPLDAAPFCPSDETRGWAHSPIE